MASLPATLMIIRVPDGSTAWKTLDTLQYCKLVEVWLIGRSNLPLLPSL